MRRLLPTSISFLAMRIAVVKKDTSETVMETGIDWGGMTAMMGGRRTVKMVLAPDPTKVENPVKQMVLQLGDSDPMEMPIERAGKLPKFEKPDPKTLVSKETVKVAAGSFKTSHYRVTNDKGTVDTWVSDEVPPIGVVKMVSTPNAGATRPGGQSTPSFSMELTSEGKDAKPTVTKAAKPFDPAALN